jgi:hypothetical protein
MASTFPESIDPFINPTYTKVNGLDYVKAEHINDLQDAVRNIEIVITGAGLSMEISSNNYVPEDSSVKSSIEILDGAIKQRQTAFEEHMDFVMPTDPFQHHANVVQVTSIGNLSATRGQSAFEEHQGDIDSIMSGGYVEGATLDDRYILKTGDVTVEQDFIALQDVYLGTSTTHQVEIAGDVSIGNDLVVSGTAQIDGDITLSNVAKIGAVDFFEYTNIGFLATGIHLKSLKDFIFTLDADDAVDALSTIAKFEIQNGIGNPIFSVDEDGIISATGLISGTISEFSSYTAVGTTRLEQGTLVVEDDTFLIKLDSNDNDAISALIVTRDNDAGTLETSTDLILKVDEARIIAGNKIQKRTIPEVGYFGMKFYSDNAGGKFQGIGVNFKSKMMTVPSSITLSINPLGSSNYNNVSITDITEYGFFVECDAIAIGHVELKGTYTTVGN